MAEQQEIIGHLSQLAQDSGASLYRRFDVAGGAFAMALGEQPTNKNAAIAQLAFTIAIETALACPEWAVAFRDAMHGSYEPDPQWTEAITGLLFVEATDD